MMGVTIMTGGKPKEEISTDLAFFAGANLDLNGYGNRHTPELPGVFNAILFPQAGGLDRNGDQLHLN